MKPDEAIEQTFYGYNVRPSSKNARITPKEPDGPPPRFRLRPAEHALPPDVRDRPASVHHNHNLSLELKDGGDGLNVTKIGHGSKTMTPMSTTSTLPTTGQVMMRCTHGWEMAGLTGRFGSDSDLGELRWHWMSLARLTTLAALLH